MHPQASSAAPLRTGVAAASPVSPPLPTRRDDDPPRPSRDAFRQIDFPLPLVSVHCQEQTATRWRVVDCSVQNEKIGAELADRKSLPIELQVHFHIGGMPGVTSRSKDGRRYH